VLEETECSDRPPGRRKRLKHEQPPRQAQSIVVIASDYSSHTLRCWPDVRMLGELSVGASPMPLADVMTRHTICHLPLVGDIEASQRGCKGARQRHVPHTPRSARRLVPSLRRIANWAHKAYLISHRTILFARIPSDRSTSRSDDLWLRRPVALILIAIERFAASHFVAFRCINLSEEQLL